MTTWVDEILSGAELFDIKESGGTPIHEDVQIVLKTSVSVPGTPVNAANLNALEQAAADATVLILRQGGSGTDWSTEGVATYTPAVGAWRIQCGSGMTGVLNGGETDFTFPVAFQYAPLVIATVEQDYPAFPVIYDVTTAGFTIKCVGCPDGLAHTGVLFNWVAFGPG